MLRPRPGSKQLSDVPSLLPAELGHAVIGHFRPNEGRRDRRLIHAGIAEYSWAECWTDYRRGAFAGFLVTVIASMIVQETARGNEMFVAMAQRHTRHAIDLGAAEFLT